MRVSKCGGATTILAQALDLPTSVAVSLSAVYFSSGDGLFSLPLAGGTPKLISSLGGYRATWIAVDEGHVYWTESNWTQQGGMYQVFRAPLGGGANEMIGAIPCESPPVEGAVAIDDDALYFVGACDIAANTRILRVPKSGGVVATVAPAKGAVGGIAIDATSVYWTSTDPISFAASVLRADKNGESAPTVLASSTGYSTGIALNDTYVYWADDGTSTLSRVPKAGGMVEILAPANSQAVAVDASGVYWADVGAVERVAP
jgi:hypothetical protein